MVDILGVGIGTLSAAPLLGFGDGEGERWMEEGGRRGGADEAVEGRECGLRDMIAMRTAGGGREGGSSM